MKSWGAQLANEKQQRDLMKTQLNEIEVESEAVPFSFEMKREGRELRPAAIQDLKALIFCLLEENSR